MCCVSRELSLDEWINKLPECHRARKEFKELKSFDIHKLLIPLFDKFPKCSIRKAETGAYVIALNRYDMDDNVINIDLIEVLKEALKLYTFEDFKIYDDTEKKLKKHKKNLYKKANNLFNKIIKKKNKINDM